MTVSGIHLRESGYAAGLLLAMWCLLGVAVSVSAAGNDQYEVATERLNVRASPSHEATVNFQIERGTEVIERMRSRLWLYVQVRDGKSPRTAGWVHSWYLAKVDDSLDNASRPLTTVARTRSAAGAGPKVERGAAASAPTVPTRTPVREATAADVRANARQPLREFKREYGRLESRYKRQTGARLFRRITERPGRVLVLTATNQWKQGTDADRQHDLFAILGLWKIVNSDYPVIVEVHDARGKVLLTAYE